MQRVAVLSMARFPRARGREIIAALRRSGFAVFFLTGCLVVGCTTVSRDFRAVWMQHTSPPADLPPPSRFTITPAQAFAVARESGEITLKNVWYLYADSDYYYVHDTFLGDDPCRAFAQGVRIDGRTGEIVRR